MTATPQTDALIFTTDLPSLLDALRAGGRGDAMGETPEYLLERLGLVAKRKLTGRGEALDRLVWVLGKYDDGEKQLADATRALLPMQVIEQELRGYGAVPEDGVMELLRRHNAAPEKNSIDALRGALRWMSTHGLVAYSQRYKTVRVLPQDAAAATSGEVRQFPSLISPRTPFTNLVRLRRTLRDLRGVVWWADPHFGARMLEELVEELDTSVVKELRIISGDAATVVTPKAKKDFERFAKEMAAKSVPAEWRIDGQANRDWHDRWLVDSQAATNMPPVNTLFKGDYSEMLPASQRPPLDVWWQRAKPL